ncbi:MAG: hypothetical protein PVI23_03835 [Maricaulaceae bacterium]
MGWLCEIDAASDTRFLWDGPNLIAECNTSGTVLRRYVCGASINEPITWYKECPFWGQEHRS